jgi:hypothetical protein
MTAATQPRAQRDDDLVLLPNHAMRARRRPMAVAALWAWEALVAFCIGWPVASTVAAFYGDNPDGDAPLWAAGSSPLMGLGMRAVAVGPSLAVHGVIGLLFALTLGVLSTGAVLTSVAYTKRDLRAPTLREALASAMVAFGPSALLFVTSVFLQVALVAGGLALGKWADDSLYFKLGEARAQQIGWAVVLLFAAIACLVGVVQETARAAVVRFRAGAGKAMRLALAALRRAPAGLVWSWAWRALAGLVPLAFGSLVAERLGGRGGLALWALVAIHQAVAMSRVALRASWLAGAMRAIDGMR